MAIASEARSVMRRHKSNSDAPLFLYVAFTAAHTPLEPDPEWMEVSSFFLFFVFALFPFCAELLRHRGAESDRSVFSLRAVNTSSIGCDTCFAVS